jgi:hypothetical protein
MAEADKTVLAERYSRADYCTALRRFDEAICEATAVSQAQAGRMAKSYIGYATSVFARMCGHGTAMIRAAPLSRWTRSDFEDWDFSTVACHARAILEGHVLYCYLIEEPASEEEATARVVVMHISDCVRRIKLHENLGDPLSHSTKFQSQLDELQHRLTSNAYFQSLSVPTQKACLNGKYLMIASRDDMLGRLGYEKGHFDALYDLWSQHTHILPLSFYRMEPSGRGTGLENDVDRSYIGQALLASAELISDATDLLVEIFPDAACVRNGIESHFSPGPRLNQPRPHADTRTNDTSGPEVPSPLANAIGKIFNSD